MRTIFTLITSLSLALFASWNTFANEENSCHATYSEEDGHLHIPYVDVQLLSDEIQVYEVNMENVSKPDDFQFDLINAIPVETQFPDTSISDLLGTWSSGRPATLGLSGVTWHSYHADGTITSNVNILDEETGCRYINRYLGKFDRTADTLSITMTSGTKEVGYCTDTLNTIGEVKLTPGDLEEASQSAIPLKIEGDTLTLDNTHTHTRVHSLSEDKILTNQLLGTWSSGRPAILGLRGVTWHSYHADGTITSNVNVFDDGSGETLEFFDDDPGPSGCHYISRHVGMYKVTESTLSIMMTSGTKEVVHCNDDTHNVPKTELSTDELAQSTSIRVPIRIEGDVLFLEAESEGRIYKHTRVQ